MQTVLDRSALLRRLGGDADFLGEITQDYMDWRPHLFSAIRSALNRGDAPALARAAHSLKASVASLGGEAASAAAFRLQELAEARELAAASEACATLEAEVQRFEQALVDLVRELRRPLPLAAAR